MLRSPTSIGCDGCAQATPMIVVDGVILGSSAVNLEAMDIQSMEVVKGAAAASLYGSRAAAGVISITTNRGAGLAQGQTQLSYRSEFGWQDAIEGTNLNTHHAYQLTSDGTSYACVTQPVCNNFGVFEDMLTPEDTTYVAGTYTPGHAVTRAYRQLEQPNSTSQTFWDNVYPTPVYDNINNAWDPGTYQQHTLNLAQNTVDTNFFLSLNRNVESGALPNNEGYSRNAFRLNIDHRFLNTLSLSVSTSHQRDVRDAVDASLSTLYTTPRDVDITARPQSQQDSIESLCDVFDCRYDRYVIPDNSSTSNPLWVEATNEDDTRNTRTQGSATLRWEPASWLNLTGTVSYDRQDSKRIDYIRSSPATGDGNLDFETDINDTWNANTQAQLRREFGDFNARVTFQASMERDKNESLDAGGSSFVFPGLPTLEAMNQDGIEASSSQSETRSNGFLVDTALDYQGRYIATVLLRRDGSSLFGPDERWQTYYRVAGNWRMSEEEWFPIDALDEFSLRYSRGSAGGRPGFSNQYEVWALSNGSVQKSQLGNLALKPSYTVENDITLQAVVGRWEVIGTYAWQRTDDQIRSVPLPGYFGYPARWMNLGAVEGTTWEFTVNGQVMQTQNFQWNTTVVFDKSNATIVEWPRPLACSGAEAWRFRCKGIGLYTVWSHHFVDSTTLFEDHRAGALMGFEDEFVKDDNGMYVWVGAGDVTYQDGPGPDGILIGPGPDGVDGTADDNHLDNLWGTSGLVNGATYEWGIPFKVADEFGTDKRLELGDGAHANLGWINNFRYGAFTFFSQFHAKIGGQIQNTGFKNITATGNSPQTDQFGRPEGLKKPARYWEVIQNGPNGSSFFSEDTSYIKLRQVSVNYRVQPTQLARFGLSNVGVTSMQVGLVARNLWMWTNFSGWDPEAGLSLTGGSQTNGGTNYPPTKTYTVEFQVTF
jgi:TonB-linked SusC/RagA family outer membrane protein